MNEPKSIPQISVDSQTLYRRLIETKIGEIVTYEELSRLIGRDVREDGYGNLTTARKKALSDSQMVFSAVRNEGLKREDDSGALSASRSQVSRARTASRKARKIAATVDPKNLTPEDRVIYDATVTTAAVLDLVTKPSKQRLLESAIKSSPYKPPLADVLALFGAKPPQTTQDPA